MKPADMKILKQVAEYKKNLLEDISSDGTLMLFYQTSNPMRTYTLPLEGSPGNANQPPVSDVSDDVLRVVERESGRELKRIKVEFFPEDVQFIPGTQLVFYKEPTKSGSKLEWRFKIWNIPKGEAKSCSDDDAIHSSYITFLNNQLALFAGWQESNKEEPLITLTLPNCKRRIIGPANPSDAKARIWGGMGFSLSSDRHQVAYGTADKVVIRNAATLNTVKEIKPPSGLIFGGLPIYTPDGKFLLVVASNTIYDKPETRRYLLFYDTTTFRIWRQLDITRWSPPDLRLDVAVNSNVVGTAMAVSADSRLLAVGYTKEEQKFSSTTEQAQVVLYDLTTGEEVARASHPSRKHNPNDPFPAKVTRLTFTPDGKYLLSSSYDTLLWEILSKGGS